MSRQCSECKTVSILPLEKLYSPFIFYPCKYLCVRCKKMFTEEEYLNLEEGGVIITSPLLDIVLNKKEEKIRKDMIYETIVVLAEYQHENIAHIKLEK